MDIEAYIASGILELYVAGALSEEQNLEVDRYAREYPEIQEEIEAIEASILKLTSTAAVKTKNKKGFEDIRKKIKAEDPTPVVTMERGRTSWFGWMGWAAAIGLAAGLWWVYRQYTNLNAEMELRSNEIQVLQDQIFQARSERDYSKHILQIFRDRDVTVVALEGQDVAPDSYAKAYWDKNAKEVFIDAEGLPEPPPGKVYQVWSLKLSPLTPTSIGLLEDFSTDENKIFALSNPNESEGFGITLEPEGGSETPTMEQLYTLGSISS